MSNAWNRAAYGFIGGQIIGGIGDMLWDPNSGRSARNKISAIFSAAGEAITGAGMGAAAGSVIPGLGTLGGAVAGGSIGLLKSAFQSRQRMDAFEKAQRDLRQALIQRSDFGSQMTREGVYFDRELQTARRTNDISYARRLQETSRARADRAQSDFLQMQTPGAYLRGMLEQGLDNETIQKRLQAYQQEYDNASKLMQLTQQQADATKSLTDELERFKDQAEAVSRAFNNALGRRSLNAIQNATEFGVDRQLEDQIRSQRIFANEVLADENSTPQAQFGRLSSALDAARANRNRFLGEAYMLNREAQLGNLTANQREDALQRRDWAMRQAGVQGDIASLLESAISQLTTQNWRPNLQNLTSLSQFGFNMGEKDDGVDIMERYWSRQIDLTRQIRDKINEGLTSEAVYQ